MTPGRTSAPGDTLAPGRSPSGGEPLPGAVRSKMEAALGADFSAIRVHQDDLAARCGAIAFARGDDLHFQPGRYDPTSAGGQELLGHELAHVVQQRAGRVSATAQAKGLPVNDDPALEHEADELGARAARGELRGAGPVATHSAASDVAQRVRVTDVEASNEDIWEEVSWYLFDVCKLGRDQRAPARERFDEIPEDKEYTYYEDIADDIADQLGVELDPGPDDDEDDDGGQDGGQGGGSRGGGSWFGTMLKLVVGYLVLTSLIPKVGASPVPGGTGGGGTGPGTTGTGGGTCSTGPMGGTCGPGSTVGETVFPPPSLICTIDSLGNSICSDPLASTTLTHVQCDPSVIELCTTTRANPIYGGLMEQVDKVCQQVTIEPPSSKPGACVFQPQSGFPVGGPLSCKLLGDYDSSKIAHELEHSYDHCRQVTGTGGLGMKGVTLVNSEIHAHTVQAAIAKLEQLHGGTIDQRDTELVRNFDAGCPTPTSTTRLDNVGDGMYSIAAIYHERYTGSTLTTTTVESTYGQEIRRGVERYKDMVSGESYELSKNYKHIK